MRTKAAAAQSRRDIIKGSIVLTVLTVSKTSSQAAASKKIGIVTTISLKKTDEEMVCFLRGLKLGGYAESGSAKQVTIPPPNEAKGNYGGSHGKTDLKNLIRGHGSVDLIVVVGGVIARESAAELFTGGGATPIPYVYLSGMAPQPASLAGQYCGVVLNIPARYANERRLLAGSAGAQDIWLVQNNNAGMTPDELKTWQTGFRNDRDFRFFEPATGGNPIDNDATRFAAEVAKLKAKMGAAGKGVIVSPDAFFRMEKDAFTTALTNASSGLGVPICYPFKDYTRRGNDQLLNGAATLSIPITSMTTDAEVMTTAYAQLGAQAAHVLDGPTGLVASRQWIWDDNTGTGAWANI